MHIVIDIIGIVFCAIIGFIGGYFFRRAEEIRKSESEEI